jgi:hypothetical protein
VTSTVKSLAVPSALIASAMGAEAAFAVPAVPVKTSTLPAFATAGAALSASTSNAPSTAFAAD